MGMCVNDHQHWHLGNTLTFTPFKDIRILATILEMEKNDILREHKNSIISSRKLRYKNTKNTKNMNNTNNQNNAEAIIADEPENKNKVKVIRL
jgi:hypothetical protein